MNTPPNPPPPPPGQPQNPYGPPQPGQQPGASQPGAQGGQPQNPYGAPQPGQAPGYGQPAAPHPGQAPQPGYGQPAPAPGAPQYGAAPQPGAPQYGYGQQPHDQSAYGVAAPYEQGEGKKKGRGALIGGGIAASVLLIGGGVFAATTLLGSSGTHPYEVLPNASFFYAEVDFDPAADQKTAYLSLKDELAEEFGFDEDLDLFEGLAMPLGDSLDYATDVEPWIGDRVGVAVEIDETADEGIVGYIAYQIGDADKLGEVRDKIEVSSLVQGEYLIIGSDERPETLPEDGFTDVLADRDGFTSDLNELDGNTIAHMWTDLSKASALNNTDFGDAVDGLAPPQTPMDDIQISGTMVAGLHLTNDYVQAQVKAMNFEVEGIDFEGFSLHNDKVAETLKNMPVDAGIALAIGGLDDYINSTLAQLSEQPDMQDFKEMIESGLREMRIDADVFIPETITRLLGTTTGLYIGSEGGTLYADGADESLLSQIVSALAETGAPDIQVTSEGETVIVNAGTVGGGNLSDNPNFDKALHNLDSAHFAFFVEPASIDPYMEDVGVIGATGSVEKDKMELTIRWVLP